MYLTERQVKYFKVFRKKIILRRGHIHSEGVLVSKGCYTQVPQTGWHKHWRVIVLHGTKAWRPEIKVSATWVLSRAQSLRALDLSRPLSLACRWQTSSCLFIWFSLYACMSLRPNFPFIRVTSHRELETTPPPCPITSS